MEMNRAIHRRGDEDFLRQLLQTIFVAELLCPSNNLWLVSPWISDLKVLDNRAGSFDALLPDKGRAHFRLSEILQALVEKGVNLTVKTRNIPDNRLFLDTLRALQRLYPQRVEIVSSNELHSKGLLSDRYYLRGSFNFTYSGVNINEEAAEFTTDLQSIAQARIEMKSSRGGE
jgi:phosphatidylserine/phosphatidylglycerophosphate/cardiolipin synthase-like enzyme